MLFIKFISPVKLADYISHLMSLLRKLLHLAQKKNCSHNTELLLYTDVAITYISQNRHKIFF